MGYPSQSQENEEYVLWEGTNSISSPGNQRFFYSLGRNVELPRRHFEKWKQVFMLRERETCFFLPSLERDRTDRGLIR